MKAKLWLLSLSLFLQWQALHGQIGFKTAYASRQSLGFELVNTFNQTTEVPTVDPGLEYSLDYWFRLKNVRLEFIPELQFARYQVSLLENPRMDVNQYSFLLNLLFYPLDWNNDCDCPTFSKTGSWFTRGFYVALSPGVVFIDQKPLFSDLVPDSSPGFTAGVGIGIDFGVLDWITLSPELGARYLTGYPFDPTVRDADLGRGYQIEASQQALLQFVPGIRVRLRFDQR